MSSDTLLNISILIFIIAFVLWVFSFAWSIVHVVKSSSNGYFHLIQSVVGSIRIAFSVIVVMLIYKLIWDATPPVIVPRESGLYALLLLGVPCVFFGRWLVKYPPWPRWWKRP